LNNSAQQAQDNKAETTGNSLIFDYDKSGFGYFYPFDIAELYTNKLKNSL